MRTYITYCLLGLRIFLWNIPCTPAQTLPANLNLVANGSFEFATCGTHFYNDSTFSNNPSCWISANRSGRAFLCPNAFYPDFNVAARSGHSAFLLTRGGSRLQLSTGNWIDTPDLYRTYAETKLLEPLVMGEKYYLKFYFGTILDTAAPTSTHTHNQDIVSNVGVYFSNNILRDNVHGGQIKVVPQLNFTSHVLPYADSFMYVALTGTYIAQGGEQYLTIGNFDDIANTVFMHITKSSQMSGLTSPYMNSVFIDDISLVADTTQSIVSLDHFELGNDTMLCAGSSMRLGGEPYFFHYWWNTGDTTRFIYVSQPGNYWCTVDYGCGNYTDTIRIGTRRPPVPFDIPDTALCAGKPFMAHAPIGYSHYAWSSGAATDSAAIYVQGTHWARITDVCGLSYTDTFRLVNTLPIVPGININSTPPIVLCDGTPTTFITNNTGAGTHPTYEWYKNGILLSGATGSNYTDAALVNGDTITVAMYSSAACPVTQPTISNRVGVTVYPILATDAIISANPGNYITAGQPVTFTAAPVNGGINPAYLWYLNGVPVPFNTTDTWTANHLKEGDEVKVRMESKVACPAPALVFSKSITIHTGVTGITHPAKSEQYSILYPNPANNLLIVAFTTPPQHAFITISDDLGRTVMAHKLPDARNSMIVEMLSKGIYFFKIVADGFVSSGKLIKE